MAVKPTERKETGLKITTLHYSLRIFTETQVYLVPGQTITITLVEKGLSMESGFVTLLLVSGL